MEARDSFVWEFGLRQCRVELPCAALRTMLRLAKRKLPREHGGTLGGQYSDNRRNAKITKVLGARNRRQAGRSWFTRPSDVEDKSLSKLHRKTKGRTHYLGEWHSHPGGPSFPSPVDLSTLQKLARSPDVAADTPILIIIGGDLRDSPDIACFVVDGDRCERGKLQARSNEPSEGDKAGKKCCCSGTLARLFHR